MSTGLLPRMSEVDSYVSLLNQRRQEIQDVLRGLPSSAWYWVPLRSEAQSTTSIMQLAADCVQAEIDWRQHIIFRLGQTSIIATTPPVEFSPAQDSLDPLFSRLKVEAEETGQLLRLLNDDQLSLSWRNSRGDTRSIRWILGHLIAFYGHRIGQMAFIRQLWESRQGTQTLG